MSYPRLVVQLCVVTGDAAEAEDLVQEAFVRAAAAGRRFTKLDNHETWLRTVTCGVASSSVVVLKPGCKGGGAVPGVGQVGRRRPTR